MLIEEFEELERLLRGSQWRESRLLRSSQRRERGIFHFQKLNTL